MAAKVLKRGTPRVVNRAATALRLAAWSLIRSRSALGAKSLRPSLTIDSGRMTLVFYRCDLKVAEMIVCRKDQFIRRAVPSALPYEAWREGNDSSWNPPTTYPAIERSASDPRGDGAAASIRVARGQG